MGATLVLGHGVASAVELLSTSVDGVVRGSEGDVIEVASIDVPPEMVGMSCSVVGQTENQESVHEGNDLLIVGSSSTLTIPNFEAEGFIKHEAGELDSLPEVIKVFVRLGPDGVSSGGFRVLVECEPPDDLETAGTSTTVAPTTTSAATTTTTSEPATTTTSEAASTTTSEPATTTTTAVATTTATVADTDSSGSVDEETQELAATGGDTGAMALLGTALVLLGLTALGSQRRRR